MSKKIFEKIRKEMDAVDKETFDFSCNKDRREVGVGALMFKRLLRARLDKLEKQFAISTKEETQGEKK